LLNGLGFDVGTPDGQAGPRTRAALQAYDELTRIFHRHRVGLLHGRMKPSEKDEAMRAFADVRAGAI
jgi:RecG-like helicase